MSARNIRIVVAALGTLIAATPALAQAGKAGDRCVVPTNADWYKKQHAWLDESAHNWSNDSLRTALLTATGLDASKLKTQFGVIVEGRDAPVALTPETVAAIAQLKRLPRGAAGPTRSAVGPAGGRAFYLLALADTSFTNSAMHRLMEAGPEESFAADVATLEDITRLHAGRKQIYGTQFRIDERNKIVLSPMEDSAHADMRREVAGLPPLALSMCMAQQK